MKKLLLNDWLGVTKYQVIIKSKCDEIFKIELERANLSLTEVFINSNNISEGLDSAISNNIYNKCFSESHIPTYGEYTSQVRFEKIKIFKNISEKLCQIEKIEPPQTDLVKRQKYDDFESELIEWCISRGISQEIDRKISHQLFEHYGQKYEQTPEMKTIITGFASWAYYGILKQISEENDLKEKTKDKIISDYLKSMIFWIDKVQKDQNIPTKNEVYQETNSNDKSPEILSFEESVITKEENIAQNTRKTR